MKIKYKDFGDSSCGITLTGENQIANKIEKVVIETPICLNAGVTLNAKKVGAFSYFSGKTLINKADEIGRFCMINRDVSIGLANRAVMSISSHFIFDDVNCAWAEGFHNLSYDERMEIKKKHRQLEFKSKDTVHIGNDVWIATGAQILLGVTIGDGAIIAAGSVVTKDVEPYSIVGGVPAKIIRKRFSEEIVEKLLKLKWWEYGPDIMKDLDITKPERCVLELEQRICGGIAPKYTCDKYIFYKDSYELEHHGGGHNALRNLCEFSFYKFSYIFYMST